MPEIELNWFLLCLVCWLPQRAWPPWVPWGMAAGKMAATEPKWTKVQDVHRVMLQWDPTDSSLCCQGFPPGLGLWPKRDGLLTLLKMRSTSLHWWTNNRDWEQFGSSGLDLSLHTCWKHRLTHYETTWQYSDNQLLNVNWIFFDVFFLFCIIICLCG